MSTIEYTAQNPPNKVSGDAELLPDYDYQDANFRDPTNEELRDLADHMHEKYGTARETIEQCYIKVIDDYKTGCPGYVGRVMITIGNAGPGFHQLYTWNHKGEISECDQAEEMRL